MSIKGYIVRLQMVWKGKVQWMKQRTIDVSGIS